MQQQEIESHKIPSLEEATTYIKAIDFTSIINKMHQHYGWNRKHAVILSEMYRKFLFLTKKYGYDEKLPPSEEIDEFWHNHILDTHQYRKDCQAIFGQYLDHYPYFGIDGKTTYTDLNNAFERTQQLYSAEFPGEIIYQVRGPLAKFIAVLQKFAKNLKHSLTAR